MPRTKSNPRKLTAVSSTGPLRKHHRASTEVHEDMAHSRRKSAPKLGSKKELSEYSYNPKNKWFGDYTANEIAKRTDRDRLYGGRRTMRRTRRHRR
jgi:hypothetical protein